MPLVLSNPGDTQSAAASNLYSCCMTSATSLPIAAAMHLKSSCFFAALTKRRLKRGVFTGIVELQTAINRYVEDHNAHPKPFVWKADPDKIIAAAARGHQTLDSIQLAE